MTGSMYAAIAGLNTHMQKMNIIGNNIANANTYGFKSGVTAFTETMYTSTRASTAGGGLYGGTNASQIGYGAKVSAVDMVMSVGTPSPTGLNSNLCLTGNGFFMVGPKPELTQNDPETNNNPDNGYVEEPDGLILTRVGNFKFDGDGYLVDPSGRCVYGFMPQGDENGEMQTTGTGKNPEVVWDKCLRPIRLPLAAPPLPDGANAEEDGFMKTNSPIYPTLTLPDNTLTYTGINNKTPGNGADGYDYNNRVKIDAVNLSVQDSGVISVVTDAGDPCIIGCVAVGMVVNPYGLTKLSEGNYQVGGNSGTLSVGTCKKVVTGNLNNAPAAGAGGGAAGDEDPVELTGAGDCSMIGGYLESSKTDVAKEFSDLITTQRGFQANTKIITVTDEMLADLVAMKR